MEHLITCVTIDCTGKAKLSTTPLYDDCFMSLTAMDHLGIKLFVTFDPKQPQYTHPVIKNMMKCLYELDRKLTDEQVKNILPWGNTAFCDDVGDMTKEKWEKIRQFVISRENTQ